MVRDDPKNYSADSGGFGQHTSRVWPRPGPFKGPDLKGGDSSAVASNAQLGSELRVDPGAEVSASNQETDQVSEATGKAAIPLPCPESLLNGSFNPANSSLNRCENKDHFDENEHRYVGLVNQAMTCYLNSLIQTLYMTPEFRNAIYKWKFSGSIADEINNIPYQLQKLFLLLQTSEKSSLETKELTASFGWESNEAYDQHDVQELCRIMFDALEHRWRKTENRSVIQDLYKGSMEDYVKCLHCGTENVRKDVFLDLPLAVKQFGVKESFKSIEEALNAFIKPEVLSENNQYECGRCASKQDAEKGLRITEFPYLLTIQLKRFDFDYQTLHRIKLNDRITFPDYLDINSFVYVPPPPPPPKMSYAAMAKKPKPADPPPTNKDEDIPPDVPCSSTNPSLSDDGERRWLSVDSRSEQIEQMLKHGKYVYELFSIMVHQGSASAGHYFAYIKNLDQNRWFCFNDSSVQPASLNDIYQTFGGYSYGWTNNMNAYMLMYRQICPSKNNKNFIRSIGLPEHLKELQEKLRLEEEEKVRQQLLDQSLVQVNFTCNEEHCMDKTHSVLLHKDTSLDSVFDEIIHKTKEADSQANSCQGCGITAGKHLVEHLLSPCCQRLILCDQSWEIKKVIIEDIVREDPLVEGTNEEVAVVGGDEVYKRPLESITPFHMSSNYLHFCRQDVHCRQEVHLMIDTKFYEKEPFYSIPPEAENESKEGEDRQLRTFNVYKVDLGSERINFAKRIALSDHLSIYELKKVLAKTIPAVALGEEFSKSAIEREHGEEKKETEEIMIEENKSRQQEQQQMEGTALTRTDKDNDSPPTSSTTNSTSPFTDEIPSDKKVVVEPHSHQPYCRLVIDNPFNDNNPMKVFGDDSVASLPIHKAVYNRYSSVTVFVDVGPDKLLLEDRSHPSSVNFDETLMGKLILRRKFSQPMKILLPTHEQFQRIGQKLSLDPNFVYTSELHGLLMDAIKHQRKAAATQQQQQRPVAVVGPMLREGDSTTSAPPPPLPPPQPPSSHSAAYPLNFKGAVSAVIQQKINQLTTPAKISGDSNDTIPDPDRTDHCLDDHVVPPLSGVEVDDPLPNAVSSSLRNDQHSDSPQCPGEDFDFIAKNSSFGKKRSADLSVDITGNELPPYEAMEEGQLLPSDYCLPEGGDQQPQLGFPVNDPTPPPPYPSTTQCSSSSAVAIMVLPTSIFQPSPADDASCSSLPAEPDPSSMDEDVVIGGIGGGTSGLEEEEELASTDDGDQQQLLGHEDVDDPSMELSSCPSTPKISPVVSEASGDEAEANRRAVLKSEMMCLAEEESYRCQLSASVTANRLARWDRSTATTTTDLDKDDRAAAPGLGASLVDDAGTSDTLVGGTESTSDSTVTATSSGEGTTDLAGTRSIKILELEDRGEQPYVIVELDKRQRAVQLKYWLCAFLRLGPSAFQVLKHYRESDLNGFLINMEEEATIKECLSSITHLTVRLSLPSPLNSSELPSPSKLGDQQEKDQTDGSGGEQRWRRRERPLRIKMLSVSESD